MVTWLTPLEELGSRRSCQPGVIAMYPAQVRRAEKSCVKVACEYRDFDRFKRGVNPRVIVGTDTDDDGPASRLDQSVERGVVERQGRHEQDPVRIRISFEQLECRRQGSHGL